MSLWLEWFLSEKTILWASFEASGLKNIFHLYAHCNIFDNSSLRDNDEEMESSATEKIELSSTKSLAFEVNPSGKSLIYTKNNKGPRIEPCGVLGLICDHFEVWQLRKTLWNLSDKNRSISRSYFHIFPCALVYTKIIIRNFIKCFGQI